MYKKDRRQAYITRIGLAVQVGACIEMLAAIRDHLGPDFVPPASFTSVEAAITDIKAEYPKTPTA